MKIVLYGTCSTPFFYRELIREAQRQSSPIEWRILLYSWRHVALFSDLLPASSILYVHEHLNKLMKEKTFSLDELNGYPASFFSDIMADKGHPGQVRTKPKAYQLQNALAFHHLYKTYLERERPDVVVFSGIESHEGHILFNVARQLNILTVYSLNTRNLGVSYFALSQNEELPEYAYQKSIDSKTLEQAKQYVAGFEKNPVPELRFLSEPDAVDVPFAKPIPVWKKVLTRIPQALWNIFKDLRLEPHAPRSNPFWYVPRAEFRSVTYFLKRLRGRFQRNLYDIRSLDKLPPRFVYFPLHFQPEATINSREPFFIDQLRVVDLLLYNIPSDHYLVVKEHPAMKGARDNSFYKEFKKKAGVILVDPSVRSTELIKRASLTVTITGTATLEALMLGKPSMLLGKAFFSKWVTGMTPGEDLRETIRKAIQEDKQTILARAVDCVTRMFTIGHPFVLLDPHDPGVDPKYTMNRNNVATYMAALLDHIRNMGVKERTT